MPEKSKVKRLPDDLRQELNRRLEQSGFSEYKRHADWLNAELSARGIDLSLHFSTVHRYGQEFEERLELLTMATEQAQAIVEATPDDMGALDEANIRLMQVTLQHAQQKVMDDPTPGAVHKLSQAASNLAKASVNTKKHAAEVAKARKEEREAAAERVEQAAQERGLSAEDAQFWRERVLMGM